MLIKKVGLGMEGLGVGVMVEKAEHLIHYRDTSLIRNAPPPKTTVGP